MHLTSIVLGFACHNMKLSSLNSTFLTTPLTIKSKQQKYRFRGVDKQYVVFLI